MAWNFSIIKIIMAKKNFSNNYLLPLAAASFALALVIHQRSPRPEIRISKQESALNLSQELLGITALGNQRLLASVLWIQTLLETDHEHYTRRDLGSWMYLRFRTISRLDPRFYENYLWGGMFLSIIKDDLEGAADIFERGLKYYPQDFGLNYAAGFNYYFEMGEFDRGLRKFEVIQDHPSAPMGLRFVINKLRFETSRDYDSTLTFLRYTYANTQDPVMQHKLSRDIYALKAERDLKCLNERGERCERTDADGQPYLLRDGEWRAQTEFTPYRIHRSRSPEK
jgi:tetratricopeptide (TPR) repeat protein